MTIGTDRMDVAGALIAGARVNLASPSAAGALRMSRSGKGD
jgi:hypothetical protein